jgi:hypothetical protein
MVPDLGWPPSRLAVVIGSFVWFTPRFTASIASSAIVPELGVAYSAAVLLDKNSFYMLPADSNEVPHNSHLVLFENGHTLGPPHVVHAEIRERGSGRYSHWNSSIIFSTPDGSDPRTNGRAYSIESSTVIKPALRIGISAILLLADAIFFVVFQKELTTFLRARASILLGALALLAIAAAGLSALGTFGTLVVANGDLPGDAALAVRSLQHAGLGCLISAGMWAAGAGLTRLVLIPAFPVGLILLAGLVAISLVAPQGRMVALALWILCLLPLLSWRPPRQELAAAVGAILMMAPLAVAFGVWLGLLWHGRRKRCRDTPRAILPTMPAKFGHLPSIPTRWLI